MNAQVHYTLTRQWAREAGFDADQAEEIARADVGVDRVYHARLLHNVGYHFRAFGARWHARRWLNAAVDSGELRLLGQALHCEQDAIAHGYLGSLWHWPGIDLWDRRSPRVRARIERATRKMLTEYLSRTAHAHEVLG